MLVYFARQYFSTRTGTRIVDLQCERCGCEYHFQLRRVGTGQGIAPYGLGTDLARSSADETSKRTLLSRLTDDTEPVPCPKCHWINDDLIVAYRWQQHGGTVFLGILLGLIALAFSFSIAWYFFRGPAADHGDAYFFLYYVPGGILLSMTLVIAVQLWRMNHFEPNRTHPNPPQLPAEIPPALLRDEATGEYVVASTLLDERPRVTSQLSNRFAFQIDRHQLPAICCVCLNGADARCEERHSLQNMGIAFPYCLACRRGLFWRRLGLAVLLVLISNALLVQAAVTWQWCPVKEIWMYSPLSLPPTMILAAIVAGMAIQPARINKVDPRRGVLHLEFKNARFSSRIQCASNQPPVNATLVQSTEFLSEQIEATISGTRLIEVRCEKCDCAYFYEMTRTANAAASTSLQHGSTIQATAINEARSKLNRELTVQTEPVPCPKCYWINEQMANDYRNRCYRGFGTISVVLAIVVTSISMLVGLIIRRGPVADHGILPTLFVYCPSTMAVFAAATIVISAWLRSRVRLNEHHPRPPELPPGIPPARLLDPATAVLSRAQRINRVGT